MAATLDLFARPETEAPVTPVTGGASSHGRRLLRAVSIAFCVGLWQIAVHYRFSAGFVSFANIPAPGDVGLAFWRLLHSAKLPLDLAASLLRVLIGFFAAAIAGIALGLAVSRHRVVEDALLPPLEMLRPIPAVAWIPLAVLLFPSSELSMVFITFIGALFPILLNTIHGVDAVDTRLVATASGLGAKRLRLYVEVVLPAAAPSIFTGLSIGMGTAWFCLVTAEMIAGQYGIGYFTWESYTLQNYADIVVGMAIIGALGMLSSLIVKRIGRAVTPWHRPEGGR